jgi:1,4-dihydroxy-2-naphthoate octaprenyltransferase
LVLPALPSLLLIQIGTNLVNDAVDFEKGADTAERLGPARVTQRGLFAASTVHAVGVACFALAALCVFPAILARGWTLVALYVASSAAGYCYTGGPFPLGYHGLGDITVILFFGVVATAVVRFIHTGGPLLDEATTLAGIQVGFLAAELLAVNNARDMHTDVKAGKRTLAVRFGLTFARLEVAFLAVLAYTIGLLGWPPLGVPRAAAWPTAAAPLSALLVWRVAVTPPSRAYNTLLALAAVGHLLFGGALAAALWTTPEAGE